MKTGGEPCGGRLQQFISEIKSDGSRGEDVFKLDSKDRLTEIVVKPETPTDAERQERKAEHKDSLSDDGVDNK